MIKPRFHIIKFACPIGVIFALLFIKCTNDHETAPDISDVNIDTRIVRFDSLLFATKTTDDIKIIAETYPQFYTLYYNQIIGFRQLSNLDSALAQTTNMQAAETFTELNRKINHQYKNFSDIGSQWQKAMKYYKYYFDENSTPDLYTCVTEFSFGSFIFPISPTKDGIGISLDMFLGDSINYTVMAKLDAGFSSYNARTFNRDHLTKKAVDALLDDLLPPARQPEFIYHLLREGKKYYASDKLLSFISDTVIWEYTPDQWQWTQDNEWNIYSFLISNDLIYSTQRSKYSKLIKPAPHTMDMPPEAPGRVAIYIGYKIVEEYMRRHPDTSMPALFNLDANVLFQAAKYKPKRE